MAVEFHRLKVCDVRRETPEAVSIAFAVPPELTAAYDFHPGQHLTLRMKINGTEVRRSYSICTAPTDGELRVAVKKIDGGVFSTFANEAIKVGDEIEVMTPQGRFGMTPDPAAARTYLAIAAGSGITPVISIVRAVLTREHKSRVMLIYGNRSTQSILFREALEDLKDLFLERFSVFHVLSREPQEIPLFNGRIDREKIAACLRTMPEAGIDHAFLCGPAGLIAESKAALLQRGLPPERIHVEYFSTDGAPNPPRPTQPAGSRPRAVAQFILHGARHSVAVQADETLMEAGLRAGLDMPYSCRGGMCCTCRAKVVEGEIRMDVNYSLEPWEIAAGYVLTCQARPVTPSVMLDYDHV